VTERTVSVAWVAKRWNTGRDTVTRLLHSGELRGYRLTLKGWWRVVEQSVLDYEHRLRTEHGAGPGSSSSTTKG
jgi:excisionase family DNA binding protein